MEYDQTGQAEFERRERLFAIGPDEEEWMHAFELARLGMAPFRCEGVVEIPSPSLAEANPSAYNAALAALPPGIGCGTCAFCGHPLRYNYIIESADGHRFVVGSECVNKTGDAGLVNMVKREKRRAAREKKEAARRVKWEATIDRQRKRNGGLTDGELAAQLFEKERAPRITILAPLAERLADGRGGFCDSVAEGLRNGDLPSGRGLEIMVDILAKQAGRSGSKAYWAEAERIEADIENL
jgi:hypothetical protein